MYLFFMVTDLYNASLTYSHAFVLPIEDPLSNATSRTVTMRCCGQATVLSSCHGLASTVTTACRVIKTLSSSLLRPQRCSFS